MVRAWRYEGLHWLEASLFRCAAVMRCASYGHQRLIGGRVSSKRRCACACCLWGAGEPPNLAKRARCTTQVVVGAWRYEGLHWLEAALLRCTAVVRRVSYDP